MKHSLCLTIVLPDYCCVLIALFYLYQAKAKIKKSYINISGPKLDSAVRSGLGWWVGHLLRKTCSNVQSNRRSLNYFHPEFSSSPSTGHSTVVVSGSRCWAAEAGGTGEGLCTAAGPEAEAAEIQSGTGARERSWSLDAGRRPGGWRRTRGGGRGGEAAWTSGKGAAGRGCSRPRADAGSCGAACRWVWRGACRPGSG